MNEGQRDTLFHFSFAVNDLDRARRFYGGLLGCPEGRKMAGRADFNFFGHHLVAHLAPDEVVGEKGATVNRTSKTPLRHFGIVMTLEEFGKVADKLTTGGADFIMNPEVRQQGTVREQMLMVCRDGCGNAIEFKGLRNITDVYAVEGRESPAA
jgi:extradiol dioxygenase family protein